MDFQFLMNTKQSMITQSLQAHSQGLCPQPRHPSHCSVASYAVQGNGQTYSSAYKNPSNCPATVVAVLPQPPATLLLWPLMNTKQSILAPVKYFGFACLLEPTPTTSWCLMVLYVFLEQKKHKNDTKLPRNLIQNCLKQNN